LRGAWHTECGEISVIDHAKSGTHHAGAQSRRPFEDHCWKDIMPPDVIELYSNYRREVGVGLSPALVAIDLYELVYQGGAKPVPQVMKSYPNSCGEYAWRRSRRPSASSPRRALRAARLLFDRRHAAAEPAEDVRATRRQGVSIDRSCMRSGPSSSRSRRMW